eukprot:CAMPEP_0172779160 /NCGR_PEP_ID=MMETSP1074-20121228/202278_1 /TAXON_ID=2916 /ORGANISM="Ceratium fusus, Strain PA161109" /LENGTH=130 /DNA_ID=CAMNT_0013616115 /DNA_START=242 /DNA_END=635 /DNA_ORIENTATION=+
MPERPEVAGGYAAPFGLALSSGAGVGPALVLTELRGRCCPSRMTERFPLLDPSSSAAHGKLHRVVAMRRRASVNGQVAPLGFQLETLYEVAGSAIQFQDMKLLRSFLQALQGHQQDPDGLEREFEHGQPH